MTIEDDLRQIPPLVDKYFPFNIFHNTSSGNWANVRNNLIFLHWHQDIELIYLAEGHAVFNIGNRSVSAVPGDLLFVNKGELHSGYSVDNTYVDFYAILFDESIFGSSDIDPYQYKLTSPFLESKCRYPVKIGQDHEQYGEFLANVTAIIREFEGKRHGYELAVKSRLNLMIVQLARHFSDSSVERGSGSLYVGDIERFKKLLLYINDHYKEKLTVDDAARLVNLSAYHFCRTFKKITGRTFIEYVNLYRVNEAEKLLRETSESITKIAELVGFNNINYFTQTFKQIKQYPPSHTRK